MPRVNVEEKAFDDARFKAIAKRLNLPNHYAAIGLMLPLWNYCTEEETYYVKPDLIDFICGIEGLSKLLVEFELCRPIRGGKVYVRGTKKRIEWLSNLRNNSKKGGSATKEKYGGQTAIQKAGQKGSPPSLAPAPAPAPAPVPAPNKEKEGFFSSGKERQEFKSLFEAIPLEVKRAMRLDELDFDSAVHLASAENRLYSTPKVLGVLYSGYKGGKDRSAYFSEKYWRIVLQAPQGLIAMRKCLNRENAAAKFYPGTQERNYKELENFLKWSWWTHLYEKNGPLDMPKLPKSLAVGAGDVEFQQLMPDLEHNTSCAARHSGN